MAKPKKSMPKKTAKSQRSPSPLRSTSGAGFEFEDLISAWLLVQMLAGEQAPAIGGTSIQLQAQVATLGWLFDDLLLTTRNGAGETGRLAMSVKSNQQVSASGLPADFINRAWEQWRDPQSPMRPLTDGIALVTQGIHSAFDPHWREVKEACEGSDITLAMSRIRSNQKQSRVFSSVQKPGGNGAEASEQETIDLIRRLYVLPIDLQLAHSETKNKAVVQCRQLLESGEMSEAEALWQELVSMATEVRLRRGTITLQDLWSDLRNRFALRQHPDYERDWETLLNITSDYKARIETALPSGYSAPRVEVKLKLESAINANTITVVFGESGSGKSALVRNLLDVQFKGWTQVWLGPDVLKSALSLANRGTLPLKHDLEKVLNATVNPKNLLVIDSAERIDPADYNILRKVLEAIFPITGLANDCSWRTVVITQAQSRTSVLGASLGPQATPVEVEVLTSEEVKLALLASPPFGWLTGHEDTISVLRNLKSLAWLLQAGTAIDSSTSSLASHTSIADLLWNYWTGELINLKKLMMILAEREASFERSFALTDLDSAYADALTPWPDKLPLRLNQRNNHVEFEHDLAADWSRFQFLKQIWSETPRWAALAENPLWSNALRMLGQYLLRQNMEHGTEWDSAFDSAEGAGLTLAGDILLDALCLDPAAEQFLTERVDFLMANNARHLTRLLNRFHHIGTVPIGGIKSSVASLALYIEAQYRSVIIGRWPPVLRFLISQREKLKDLISPALAKVIQTWLTQTPQKFGDGTQVPFRQELAEIALNIARKVQLEKGKGVIFSNFDSLLYTAPLAGAMDLPDNIGAWALELAGRREIATEVEVRLAQARQQQIQDHFERLQSDPKFKEKHEKRRRVPTSLGAFREKLPPWPLGASRKVDWDFRASCLKGNGLQALMRARPDVASEVLLALIVEDQPERDNNSSRHEVGLGLDYTRDGYPTAYWKSPFFSFLQIQPVAALKALISLVNFCTERWVAEVMKGRKGSHPGLKLLLAEDEEKIFSGWREVFEWTQSNSLHNGNLFCALDALERWLTLQLDDGIDITTYVDQIVQEGESIALIGTLVNVGKYRSNLFNDKLAPLLTDPHIFYWDSDRVKNIELYFDSLNWARAGEIVFNIARDWTLAPHRQKSLQDVIVDLLKVDAVMAKRLQALIPNWSFPVNAKEALEFRLLFAILNSDNYRYITDNETGDKISAFICPDDLRLEVQAWQDEHSKSLQYLMLPKRCEYLLQAQQVLGEDESIYFHNLLKEHEADSQADEGVKTTYKVALAATLIVLAESWLERVPAAKEDALSLIRMTIDGITSTGEEIRNNRIRHRQEELKFASYAAMHLWMKNDDESPLWEASVVRLFTSGNSNASEVIIDIAYAYRERLGSAWWRLLHLGLLWSGLSSLSPRHRDDDSVRNTWNYWLARIRRFPLRSKAATLDDLKITRIAAGCDRLDYHRRMRAYTAGDRLWRRMPEHRTGPGLDMHFLGILFRWLINGPGTGDWTQDAELAERLWAYEAKCAIERAKDDNGEYPPPSQNLGYDLLQKLGELTLTAPDAKARKLWESVLDHGPEAHYALQHFIKSIFQCQSKGGGSTQIRAYLEGNGGVWAFSEVGGTALLVLWREPDLRFTRIRERRCSYEIRTRCSS